MKRGIVLVLVLTSLAVADSNNVGKVLQLTVDNEVFDEIAICPSCEVTLGIKALEGWDIDIIELGLEITPLHPNAEAYIALPEDPYEIFVGDWPEWGCVVQGVTPLGIEYILAVSFHTNRGQLVDFIDYHWESTGDMLVRIVAVGESGGYRSGGDGSHKCITQEMMGSMIIRQSADPNNRAVLTIQSEPANMVNLKPSFGTHIYCIGKEVELNADRSAQCPYIYDFNHWSGDIPDPCSVSQYIIMDSDKTITAYYEPDVRRCGDECHPIHTPYDINEDCRVDFVDFAYMADVWGCSHPDCD